MTELKINLKSPEAAAFVIRLLSELNKDEIAEIVLSVIEELRKAEKKHPDWSQCDLFEQVCILSEEAGEVSKAVLDFHNGSGTIEEFKTELKQTAAMCLRILKNLDDEET